MRNEKSENLDFLKLSDPVPNDKLRNLAVKEEAKFLSFVLKDKKFVEDAVDSGITFECFQTETLRRLYCMATEQLSRHDGVLSIPALESVLAASSTPAETAMFVDKYNDIVGEFGLKDSDYSMLKESIEARYVQRQAYAICKKFHAELLESMRDQRKVVAKFQELVSDISAFGDATKFEQIAELNDVFEKQLRPEIIERRDHPDKFQGIKCGWKEIDDIYNGFQKQRYMIISATEGGGKSTFMVNLARNFAMGGANVVYVTIESLNLDIARRLLTIESQVSYTRMMRGGSSLEFGLSPYIMKELDLGISRSKARMKGKFHLIQVLENTSREHICRLIKRIKAGNQVDVVFIDYLQVVKRESNFGERIDQAIAEVSNGFRAWGRTNNCLMVTASQIKSDKGRKLQERVKNEDEITITKGDTSGSKEIAGAADYMFGVWIPLTKDRMVIFPSKHRQGKEVQKFVMSFDADSGRLSEMSEFGNPEAIAEVVKSKSAREQIRKTLDSGTSVNTSAIPGTSSGESEPAEIIRSVEPGASPADTFCGDFSSDGFEGNEGSND